MDTEIIITGDGSSSLFVPGLKEQYHSRNGAVQESKHVFIEAGMGAMRKQNFAIFEMGFGTGLNALLSFLKGKEANLNIKYHCIENYPLDKNLVDGLNYQEYLNLSNEEIHTFKRMHECKWGKEIGLSEHFSFLKNYVSLTDIVLSTTYDLVYFDAFAPGVQPELWTEKIFQKLYNAMNSDARLVTYCAKGEVRRKLQRCGFFVERLPGPPGKREILRACKKE